MTPEDVERIVRTNLGLVSDVGNYSKATTLASNLELALDINFTQSELETIPGTLLGAEEITTLALQKKGFVV